VRIVVTGASGFVGRALARRLPVLGHEMVAVTRTEPPAGVVEGVRWSGVTDRIALRAALRNADALVHLAARVHVMHEASADPLTAFRQVNVDGACAAADVARELGVARSLLMSTVKVLGEGRSEPFSDEDAPAPADAYAVSKYEAEAEFRQRLPASGWTVLRPPLVYGPGVAGNLARLLRLGVDLAGVPLPLGAALGPRSLVFADNLADAVVAALQSQAAGGQTYVVADSESPTTADLLRDLARHAGRRAVLFPVPRPILRAVARLSGRGAEIGRLAGSLVVDSSRFCRDTGWAQAVSLDGGLARTVAWWKERRRA
jgi:UDP-glucose 4-epimerase